MKKITTPVIILLCLLSIQITAQRRFDLKEQLKDLKIELDLSDSQTVAVEKILEMQRDKTRDLMDSFDGDRSERRDVMVKLRNETSVKIKAVLNKEQIKKYDEYEKKMSERRRGNRRG